MVFRKNLKVKFALVSVFNKNKLKYICNNLVKYNYSFISSANTCKKIRSLGFECLEISEITGFKEILDGRVKTLNPKVFASILHDRNNKNHLKQFKNLKFPQIDIVIVNLYPFKKFISLKNHKNAIEMIDIGGSSLLRAASKNHTNVTAICELSDYSNLIKNLKKNNGLTDYIFRKKMAIKVFKYTSVYDNEIYKYLEDNNKKISKKHYLRYGENPFQKSYILKNKNKSITDFQISGKAISYNNIIDIDSGYKCLNEFNEPTCVIIKHTNPCGISSSKNILSAYKKALDCDKKSAFGGIVLLNKKINLKLAKIISKSFFEVVVAKDFDNLAIKYFKNKENLILVKIKNIKNLIIENRSTIFGDIYQECNNDVINKNYFKLVSLKKITKKSQDDLIFATKVVKHLKSNSIALVKNKQTIGLGMGQTSRIDSVQQAIKKMKINFNSKNFVCVSDGFFPFNDSIRLLKNNYCNIIAQPSGSKNDNEIIKFALNNKLSLFFLKRRLFKH